MQRSRPKGRSYIPQSNMNQSLDYHDVDDDDLGYVNVGIPGSNGGIGRAPPKAKLNNNNANSNRVRAPPAHPKPRRGKQNSSKSEVGKIATFVNLNDIPDGLPDSPKRRGIGEGGFSNIMNYGQQAPSHHQKSMHNSPQQPQYQQQSNRIPAYEPMQASPNTLRYNMAAPSLPSEGGHVNNNMNMNNGYNVGMNMPGRIVPKLSQMRPMQMDDDDSSPRVGNSNVNGSISARSNKSSRGNKSSARSDYNYEHHMSVHENIDHGFSAPNSSRDDYDGDEYNDNYKNNSRNRNIPQSRDNSHMKVNNKKNDNDGYTSWDDDEEDLDEYNGGGDDPFFDNDRPLSSHSYSSTPERNKRGATKSRNISTKNKNIQSTRVTGGGALNSNNKIVKSTINDDRNRKMNSFNENTNNRHNHSKNSQFSSNVSVSSNNNNKVHHNYVPPALPIESMSEIRNSKEKEFKGKDKLYYSKAPRQVDYKPGTLNSYVASKPKEYVEIKKSKPDLNTDELKAKRANAARVKEFSKKLTEYNKQAFREQRKLPSSKEMSAMSIAKSKYDSKREKMLEFARQIPKPKPKPIDEKEEFEHGYMTREDEFGMSYEAAMRMQELEAKHAQSQARVDSIKRALKNK